MNSTNHSGVSRALNRDQDNPCNLKRDRHTVATRTQLSPASSSTAASFSYGTQWNGTATSREKSSGGVVVIDEDDAQHLRIHSFNGSEVIYVDGRNDRMRLSSNAELPISLATTNDILQSLPSREALVIIIILSREHPSYSLSSSPANISFNPTTGISLSRFSSTIASFPPTTTSITSALSATSTTPTRSTSIHNSSPECQKYSKLAIIGSAALGGACLILALVSVVLYLRLGRRLRRLQSGSSPYRHFSGSSSSISEGSPVVPTQSSHMLPGTLLPSGERPVYRIVSPRPPSILPPSTISFETRSSSLLYSPRALLDRRIWDPPPVYEA